VRFLALPRGAASRTREDRRQAVDPHRYQQVDVAFGDHIGFGKDVVAALMLVDAPRFRRGG
jgi:hypothetical protein